MNARFRNWLGITTILFTVLTIQACAPKSQEDCGFVQNVYGERVSWQSDVPVNMYIHSSVPVEMDAAIIAAADSWQTIVGRKIINIMGRTNESVSPHKDGKNIIYFMTSWEANRTSEQGRTSLYWIGDLIKEADIRLNGADFSFYYRNQSNVISTAAKPKSNSAAVNIEALVLHEMGHVLGLKHKDTDDSVMATFLASGEDRVNVAPTDEKALQCEY
ncbi:matrixin family metalloprotease [Bdellovibrio reynosensis]|uniref:Matrixin family metalloprotease n=1 Tax=Bdellovibrio reynosensis TaxID=2835041 RepID=A0ABY4CK69_9BACT|nr:matrixin family metalloprotease [Bdellovibrio reynosensis]UOF02635.1 matrixin family metalloprotease [Bdellovibrio reynosensis]